MELPRKDATLARQPPPAEKAAISPAALLEAFGADWLDADRCRDWLLRRLHPSGPACPHCSCPAVSRRKWQSFYSGGRIKCSQCDRFYRATSGTLLEGAKLAPAQLVLLALCLALNLPIPTTAALCGVNANTIRFWRDRLEAPV